MDVEKMSYTFTPRQTPYRYCTFKDLLQERTQLYGNEEAFICYSKDGTRDSITYKDLSQKAKHIGRYLITTGISKGDRITMYGSNSLNMVIAEFAVIMAGAVPVYLTFKSADAADAIDIIKISECKCLLLDPGQGDKLLNTANNIIEYMQSTTQTKVQHEGKESTVNILILRENVFFKKFQTIHSVLEDPIEDVELPTLYPEDLVILFTTSGTTGNPKIVEHTHFGLMNISFGLSVADPGEPLRKLYCDRPFGWIGGSILTSLALVEKQVFIETAIAVEGENTEFIWSIIQSEKCTYLSHVPYFLVDLLAIENKIENSFKLKCIITGGEMVQKHHLKVVGVYCEQLNLIYGSTDVSMATIICFTEENMNTKEGDLGFPLPGTEVKIVDERKRVTKINQTGEICIRSAVLSTGFFNNDAKTKECFIEGGWVRTGDVGYISNGGHVFIQNRLSEVISRGTRKIMPSSVEEVIMQMEGLERVAVVAVPDERLYHEVCACFTIKANYDIVKEMSNCFRKRNLLLKCHLMDEVKCQNIFFNLISCPFLRMEKPTYQN